MDSILDIKDLRDMSIKNPLRISLAFFSRRAGDEKTLEENACALDCLKLLLRVLRNVAVVQIDNGPITVGSLSQAIPASIQHNNFSNLELLGGSATAIASGVVTTAIGVPIIYSSLGMQLTPQTT